MQEPVIECGVCRLRPFRLEDADSLMHHANNRNVSVRLRDRFPYPYTKDHARQFLAAVTKRHPDVPEFVMAIEVDGMAVGGIGVILGTDVERISGELGYWLGEEYWRRGIVTAAIRHFAPWVMEQFHLTRLHADTFHDNPASARVLEKAGFTKESVKRRAAIKDGEIKDMHVYVLLR
ncbi:MAG: GNAT family N-acetyltransferase [Acidobacteriaceae bacterium]